MFSQTHRKPLIVILVVAAVIGAGWAWFTRGGATPLRYATSNSGYAYGGMMGAPAPSAPQDSYAYGEKSALMMPISERPPMMGGETAAEVDQKIIKTGNLDLVVADVAAGSANVTSVASKHKGYVESSSFSERGDGTHAGNITVRVPSSDFEATMSEIKEMATLVRNESVNGQDVTEQYSDLQAQLRNAQAQEVTYLGILKQAHTVSDVLQVQQQLGQIRGQIESLQGRIKYLTNVTSYSTITVSIAEEASVRAPTKEFKPLTIIKQAAQALVVVFQSLVTFTIWFIIIGLGLLIPAALFIWFVVWVALRLLKRFWKK